MKLSAKLIIEDEFDRKFLTLKSRSSKLEQFLWDAQVRESNNLEGETPVLNSIATAKKQEVKDVATSTLSGQADFKEKVIELNTKMIELKQEFKDCATIRELNVLWQKYMGISVPFLQAEEMGLVDDDGQIAVVDPGLHF